MKETFLSELARRLYADYGKDIEHVQILFPNRRSVLFFQQALSEQLEAPIWGPRVESLHDFLCTVLDYQRPDDLELLLLLYEVYREVCTERQESLDRFFVWGEILLRDMGDITNYECRVEELFTHVEDIKELDSHFLFRDADKAAVAKRFWTNFTGAQHRQKEAFLRWWRMLPKLYTRFHEDLQKKRWAYEGYLTHLAAQRCREQTFPKLAPTHTLVFAGFPALSESEKAFIQHFVKHHEARVFWDIDAYYVEQDWHTAGTFFRQYRKDKVLGKTFPVQLPRFFEKKKARIEVRVAPSAVAQVKSAAAFLEQHAHFEKERIAIVLPDEQLLLPLLHALPEACMSEVNVTMGYSLEATPVSGLLEHLLLLWEARATPSLAVVLPVLEHVYLQPLSTNLMHKHRRAHQNRHKQKTHPPTVQALCAASPVLEKICRAGAQADARLLNWLADVFAVIKEALEEAEKLSRFDEQLFNAIIDRLQELQDSPLQDYLSDLSVLGRKRLMKRMLKALRVPFSGEPLQNIQIMGIYDTRNLDVDRLIILDMNEGLWPVSTRPASFLPHPLRQAYGLPDITDACAVSSYLFYRLLQRCPCVRIYYVQQEQVRERSSFLYQLAYESMHRLDETFLDTSIHIAPRKAIEIPKTEAVLRTWLDPQETVKLSVGALATYLDCPLRFYFRYIEKLVSPAEESEELALGSIFHDTMQALYAPYEGQDVVTANELEACEKQLPILLDKACAAYYHEASPTGTRHLIKQVLVRMLRSMLREDKAYAPFQIVALEKEYGHTFSVQVGAVSYAVQVYGRLDRVDYKEQTGYRVLDYKTGYMQSRPYDWDTLFDKEKASAYRIQRQILVYAYLYGVQAQVDVQACVALSRALLSGHEAGVVDLGAVRREDQLTMGEKIAQLLNERIFNTNEPFTQTKEVKKICVYCPYRRICHGEATPTALSEDQK